MDPLDLETYVVVNVNDTWAAAAVDAVLIDPHDITDVEINHKPCDALEGVID